MTAAQAVDAMAKFDPVVAAQPAYWPAVDREDDSITLLEGDDRVPCPHPRTLLGQHEVAAFKVTPGSDRRTVTCSGKTWSP
jgi:hypothetical protein